MTPTNSAARQGISSVLAWSCNLLGRPVMRGPAYANMRQEDRCIKPEGTLSAMDLHAHAAGWIDGRAQRVLTPIEYAYVKIMYEHIDKKDSASKWKKREYLLALAKELIQSQMVGTVCRVREVADLIGNYRGDKCPTMVEIAEKAGVCRSQAYRDRDKVFAALDRIGSSIKAKLENAGVRKPFDD